MKQTRRDTGLWTEWPDFDEEGETGRTIIGDAEGRSIFCTCEATEAEKNLAKAAPEMLEALHLSEQALSEFARTDDGTPSISALIMIRAIIAKT